MQQASQLQQPGHGGRLGARVVRLLYHRRVAWWSALLAVAGSVQFVSFVIIAMLLIAFEIIVYDQEQLALNQTLGVLIFSTVAAFLATIYTRQTQKDTFFDSPKNRLPRKRWGRFASGTGAFRSAWQTYFPPPCSAASKRLTPVTI